MNPGEKQTISVLPNGAPIQHLLQAWVQANDEAETPPGAMPADTAALTFGVDMPDGKTFVFELRYLGEGQVTGGEG